MITQGEVIETYIEEKKKGSIIGQINSFLGSLGIEKGINFGGGKKVQEYIDLYLANGEDSTETGQDEGESIKDNVNNQLGGLQGGVKLAILETQLSLTCSYFAELKELLDIIKENKVDLSRLKHNIEQGLEFDAVSGDDGSSSNNVSSSLSYSGYENLKPGTYSSLEITQDEVDYVKNNAPYVIEELKKQTAYGFSGIKSLKNKDGGEVLKSGASTPVLNEKAAEDLVGLALLFYKKTGQSLDINSPYRTPEHQQELVNQNANKGYTDRNGQYHNSTPTAPPGMSGHNLGYSIDVSPNNAAKTVIGGQSGLDKMMEMFNFHGISTEDRHFNYVDFTEMKKDSTINRVELAQEMSENFKKFQSEYSEYA